METGNTELNNITLKFVQAITAVENEIKNLIDIQKGLGSRLDSAASTDNALRNDFIEFKTRQDLQVKQLLKTIDDLKNHLKEHCDEIEEKVSSDKVTALENRVTEALDRVVAIEQARSQEAAKRKIRQELEKAGKEEQEKKRQIEMDNFTRSVGKKTLAITAAIGILTIIAMFLVVDYQARKEKQNDSNVKPTQTNNAQPTRQ